MNKSIIKLVENRNPSELMKRTICFIFPKIKSSRFIIISLISIFVGVIVSFSENTVIDFKNILEISQNTSLTLFAVLLTGFSIFQALMSEETMKAFSQTEDKENNCSLLITINFSSIGLLYSYIVLILINFLLKIIYIFISDNWSFMYFNLFFNQIISTLLISAYLFMNINNIVEILSFVYNLSQTFNFLIAYKLLNATKTNKK